MTHEKESALLHAWATRDHALGRAGREVVCGLVPRACDRLDLNTCRHHELLPASFGKSSTQGSLSGSGYPASPSVEGGVAWTWC